MTYDLPWFVDDPLAAMAAYRKPRTFVALDFETTNNEFGSALNPDNHIVLACWEVATVVDGKEHITPKYVWGDEYSLAELEEDINNADFVVAHNAKFELQWLKRCGLELRDILVFDTFLAEWVIAGNRGGQAGWELNLDDTAARYGLPPKLSAAKLMLDAGIDTVDIPREYLLPYCFRDVQLTRLLFKKQMKVLEEQRLLHLALTRNLCCAVLADLEFNGAELDPVRVKQEYDKSVEEFREVDALLNRFTKGVNLSSTKQLGEYLYGELGFPVPKDHRGRPILTSKGAYKTDVKTLDKLKATTKEQEEFITLYKKRNSLDSLISKNLEFFKLVCDEKAGKFYGNINQGFTQTHRLASTGRPILFSGTKRPRGKLMPHLSVKVS